MGNERSFKKFSFTEDPNEEKEVYLEIEYTDARGRSVTEGFHFVNADDMPAEAAGEFLRLNGADQWIVAFKQFIEECMMEEDVPRWQRLMKTRRAKITTKRLGEIFEWLQEQYTGHPTLPSNGSPVGRSTTSTG